MSDLSRVEQLLRNALGEDIYEVTPQSRVEALLVELNELIEGMGGSVSPEAIATAVAAYLDEHLTNPTNPPIDTSLTIAGAAADAKKTGDKISELKSGFNDLDENLKSIQNDTITSANMFDGVFGIVGGANVDGTFNTNTRFMRSDYLPLKEGLGRTLYTSNSANEWASVIVYAEDKSCFGAIANERPLPDEARYFVVTKAAATTADFYVGTSPFSGDYSYSTAKMIKPDALQNGLRKKTVVLMGDSTYAITGGSGARISDFLALLGDCTVVNCSFGGTRLSDSRGVTSADSYKPFDFPNLVDAIVSNDFTTQNNSLSGKTSQYITNLSNLEGVDFSKVDCLILAYGANDFTGNVDIGTNESNRTTFRGALIYGAEKLMSGFPNLMIVVDGQRYRAWLDASTKVFADDVFTHRNNNDQLTSDYINALESQCALMGVPYFNNLYHYGWNKYTRINYFPAVESGASASSADGAHFDIRGVKYATSVLYKNLCMLGFAQNL